MMKDKTFGEIFPSLKGKECNILITKVMQSPISIRDNKDGTYTLLEDNEMYAFEKGFFKEDIQKHCLDKQRVRKVILDIIDNLPDEYKDFVNEELGLEL